MIPFVLGWMKRNVSLVLLLSATTCLALVVGDAIGQGTWSWMMPVSLSAVLCAWGLGASQLNPKQAWVSLTGLGIPGVFLYIGELVHPLGRLILSVFTLIFGRVLWLFDRVALDSGPLLLAWTEFIRQLTSIFLRLGVWFGALLFGNPIPDPAVAGLVWNLALWLVGAWGGWQLRRNQQALAALAPGGALLAVVLEYTHGGVGTLIVYLAILLTLIGLTQVDWLHAQWQQRKVDYSESVRIDTLLMVGVVTIALVLSAAGSPSLSWRDLVDKLREKDQGGEEQVTESLGLDTPPELTVSEPFHPATLPRQHLLGMPPDQLQSVVFTVRTGELPPIATTVDVHPNRYYWRAVTFDVYTGVGWSSSPAQDVTLPANTLLLGQPQDYRVLNQNIQRASSQNKSVYWAGLLARSDVPLVISWRTTPPLDTSPIQPGDLLGVLSNSEEFNIVSYIPQQVSISRLRAAGDEYPAQITSQYLQLPESTPERVLSLARELTQASPTPYDRAMAIESYLRTFPYTLEVEPPPFGRDVADYFLFTAQQGYCDYYATTMVVLARAAGLPARLVIGYANGEYDAPTATYIVRRKHAHSWPEIYFSGIGWVDFEPTAGQPAIVRPGREGNDSGQDLGLPAGERSFPGLGVDWRELFSTLAGQAIIAVIGLVLAILLWQMGESTFLRLLPAQQVISRMYSRMERAATRLLPDLSNGHTPHQLQIALIHKLNEGESRLPKMLLFPARTEIEEIVALHVAQVFSQHSPTKSQASKGIRAWMRLRWRLWVANRWS